VTAEAAPKARAARAAKIEEDSILVFFSLQSRQKLMPFLFITLFLNVTFPLSAGTNVIKLFMVVSYASS
jgi:hypothetical protein